MDRRVPERRCVACRHARPKKEMVRLVRTQEGVMVDPTGKRSGRGAYICPEPICWIAAMKGTRLDGALKTAITAEDRQGLVAFADSLAGAPGVSVSGGLL